MTREALSTEAACAARSKSTYAGLASSASRMAVPLCSAQWVSSSIGWIAVQLAKWLGAHVITTASARKLEFVTGLGADEVIDYRQDDFAEAVDDVDVVLDTVGGDYGQRSLAVLRPGGLLVTAVDRVNATLTAAAEAAGKRFAGIAVDPDPVALQQLADLSEQGSLRVHVRQTFPLEQVADAHKLLGNGHVQGKVVLTID
jgi:NADPH:quinone reductase-like Zn-dependent oxidoreductase